MFVFCVWDPIFGVCIILLKKACYAAHFLDFGPFKKAGYAAHFLDFGPLKNAGYAAHFLDFGPLKTKNNMDS